MVQKLYANQLATGNTTSLEAAPTDPTANDTRTTGTAEVWSVAYSFVDGTGETGAESPADYTATPGTLVFQPSETSKTIVVPIIHDTEGELAQTFTVQLTNPTGGQTHGDPPNFRENLAASNSYSPASGSGDPLSVIGTINRSDNGVDSAGADLGVCGHRPGGRHRTRSRPTTPCLILPSAMCRPMPMWW